MIKKLLFFNINEIVSKYLLFLLGVGKILKNGEMTYSLHKGNIEVFTIYY